MMLITHSLVNYFLWRNSVVTKTKKHIFIMEDTKIINIKKLIIKGLDESPSVLIKFSSNK